MKSLSFALVTFIALCVSVVSVQAQTESSNSACQKICSKVCSKSMAATKVVDQDATLAEKTTTNKEEKGQAVTVSLVETKTAPATDVASPVNAKTKANCNPADCKPANCDPANCKPINCDPSQCKKKAAADKAL